MKRVNFLRYNLAPSLGVAGVTFMVSLSLGALRNMQGSFDTRKQAAEEIIEGRALEVVSQKSMKEITRSATVTSLTLGSLFFALTYVSVHERKVRK